MQFFFPSSNNSLLKQIQNLITKIHYLIGKIVVNKEDFKTKQKEHLDNNSKNRNIETGYLAREDSLKTAKIK